MAIWWSQDEVSRVDIQPARVSCSLVCHHLPLQWPLLICSDVWTYALFPVLTIKSGHCCVLWLFLEEILSLHWLAYWCSYFWTLLHCILLGKFGVMHVEIVNKCLFLVEETGLVVLRSPLSVVQCWTAVWLGKKFLNPVMGPCDGKRRKFSSHVKFESWISCCSAHIYSW